MHVLITAATEGEWMPCSLAINSRQNGVKQSVEITFSSTGVGMLASAVSLTQLAMTEKPDLIIQMGIAGTFDTTMPLGQVLVIKDECLGDTGVLENGEWKDIFDLQLQKDDQTPFEKRKLPNPWLDKYNLLNLPAVSAVTINEISTSHERIATLIKKYSPVIESMEGAALHFIGRQLNIPFLQLRTVSNYVGERNKANWIIKESIARLNETVIRHIDRLEEISNSG